MLAPGGQRKPGEWHPQKTGGPSNWPVVLAWEPTVFPEAAPFGRICAGVYVPGSLCVGALGSLLVIKLQTTPETFKNAPSPLHFMSILAQLPLHSKQRVWEQTEEGVQGPHRHRVHTLEHSLKFEISTAGKIPLQVSLRS